MLHIVHSCDTVYAIILLKNKIPLKNVDTTESNVKKT